MRLCVFVIGEIDDRPSSRVSALRAALIDAGVTSPGSDDIRTAVWQKLLRCPAESAAGLCACAEIPTPTLDALLVALIAHRASARGLYAA